MNIWNQIKSLEEKIEENTSKLVDEMVKINIGDNTRDFERLMQTANGNYRVDEETIIQMRRAQGNG